MNKKPLRQETQMSLLEKRSKDLVLYSPINCFKHSSKLRTVKDAITSKSKTLAVLKRENGKEWVIGLLSLWLLDLNSTVNAKSKLSDVQIEFICERIYDTYSLKIADITLFFRNVKEGVYGSYYENLSQEKIMQWMAEYYNERCEVAEMVNYGSNSEFTKIDKMHPDVAKEMFRGVGDEKSDHFVDNGIGKRFREKQEKILERSMDKLISSLREMTDEELVLVERDYKEVDGMLEYVGLVRKEMLLRKTKAV